MTKKICMTIWVIIFSILAISPSLTVAEETKKPELEYTQMLFYVGGKYDFSLKNAPAKKVKWKTTNTRIATVSKKGKVIAKKIGTCKLIATYKKKAYKCKIVVKSNHEFVKSWCKMIGNEIKHEHKSPYDRVIAAATHINAYLNYGSSSNAFDALKKGRGTCVSGNALLVELLKSMGFKAKLRFAAKDKMSRYPSVLNFGSDHHNVKVTIKGKTYYVDGTPGSLVVYLSDETKPVYCDMYVLGTGWTVMIDKLPGHSGTDGN